MSCHTKAKSPKLNAEEIKTNSQHPETFPFTLFHSTPSEKPATKTFLENPNAHSNSLRTPHQNPPPPPLQHFEILLLDLLLVVVAAAALDLVAQALDALRNRPGHPQGDLVLENVEDGKDEEGNGRDARTLGRVVQDPPDQRLALLEGVLGVVGR